MRGLPILSANTSLLTRKNDCFELSIYHGELTAQNTIKNVAKLKKAFPQLSENFYDVLLERFKEHKFSDERVEASINHVIDTCIYPQPTLAQFIEYDKNVKIYNYHDMIKIQNETGMAFKMHTKIRLPNVSRPMWARNEDVEKYQLLVWEPEKKD